VNHPENNNPTPINPDRMTSTPVTIYKYSLERMYDPHHNKPHVTVKGKGKKKAAMTQPTEI
jgi:hypothetical protein